MRFRLAPLAVLLCAALPVAAQDAGMIVTKAKDVLEVEVSSAVTASFVDPFRELSIADPEIADIATLSDTLVYVLGKSVGVTTLTLISGTTPVDARHVRVAVYRDTAPMQAFLSSVTDVTLARDGAVVTLAGCAGGARARAAVDGVTAQLQAWGYVILSDVGDC
ncbi:pilus assembly protein N-terminal domain-containing protein [Maliponia aquimaris]|uniref:Pilus formation protein N-terminal domain-containing protein n=1 Tax=Maliponia aquimaris TaxID=1673631 RepID=A0A238KCA8_9RHOB|nr:pilus assembly protein N-terminal domain-containing protein [Maliponia aquimaris]SMX40147.1 hypothetical protein MAA8898_02053 [Maliponia aquimaris]